MAAVVLYDRWLDDCCYDVDHLLGGGLSLKPPGPILDLGLSRFRVYRSRMAGEQD